MLQLALQGILVFVDYLDTRCVVCWGGNVNWFGQFPVCAQKFKLVTVE